MKLLISWLAFREDFKRNDEGAMEVNPEGPTVSFHKNFYKHDKHLLLFTGKSSETKAIFLENYIRNKFDNHVIDKQSIDIQDPIDVSEIYLKLSAFLAKYEAEEVEVYISPGTPSMQTAWYLLFLNNEYNFKLFRTREARFTKDKKPGLIEEQKHKSIAPITAMIYSDKLADSGSAKDYVLTPSIKNIYNKAKLVANTDGVTTLILGESGVGKENLAQFIHDNSNRSQQSIVKVNCSAFSDQLLESRLFGYKKGAFTGADKDQEGLFQQANGGTIFLDEIGDISSYMQQSLLRVLQSGEVNPIGDNKVKKVNVRVIGATNKNLVEMCKKGTFRWDLFYRLAVVELELPPLRKRGKKEVEQLLRFFIKKLAKDLKKSKVLTFSKEAMEIMLSYKYPGNVRELINILSRLYVFIEDEVKKEDLPDYMLKNDRKKLWSLEEMEKKHIEKALTHFKNNQRQTAIHLGCSINTLKNKIEKYQLKK